MQGLSTKNLFSQVFVIRGKGLVQEDVQCGALLHH